MSCCTLANGKFSFSKCSLVLCNLIFALVGFILLAVSLFINFSSDWSALFASPNGSFSMLYFMIGLGATILLVSSIGMRAAMKESKPLLCIYLVVVLAALTAQLFVATLTFQFNSTVSDAAEKKTGISSTDLEGFQRSIMKQLGDSTANIYTNGNCSTTTDTDTELEIKCSAKNSAWFETFVNERCVPVLGSWDSASLESCEELNKGTKSDASVAVWCKCEVAVSSELQKYSKPLTVAAIAMAVVETFLFLSASYMVCCYNKRRAQEERLLAEQSDSYRAAVENPTVANDGINMV